MEVLTEEEALIEAEVAKVMEEVEEEEDLSAEEDQIIIEEEIREISEEEINYYFLVQLKSKVLFIKDRFFALIFVNNWQCQILWAFLVCLYRFWNVL